MPENDAAADRDAMEEITSIAFEQVNASVLKTASTPATASRRVAMRQEVAQLSNERARLAGNDKFE